MRKTLIFIAIVPVLLLGASCRSETLTLSEKYIEASTPTPEAVETETERVVIPKVVTIVTPVEEPVTQSVRMPWYNGLKTPEWFWSFETETEGYCIWYLSEHGLSLEAACGIAANISRETGNTFDPLTTSEDGSIGLCQWIGNRQTNLLERDDWDTVDGQLSYILWELRNTHSVDLSGTAYDCAYDFSLYYEAPLAGRSEARARASLADEIYEVVQYYENRW